LSTRGKKLGNTRLGGFNIFDEKTETAYFFLAIDIYFPLSLSINLDRYKLLIIPLCLVDTNRHLGAKTVGHCPFNSNINQLRSHATVERGSRHVNNLSTRFEADY
jgi:hypothetical protein